MNNSIGVFNAITGENEVSVMTDAQQSARNADVAAYADVIAARQAEAEAAATQKAALLARLGITADEAKLLIG